MKITGDDYVLSSGHTASANCQIIGLWHKPTEGYVITDGYDGDFFDFDQSITPADKVEVADHMIREWIKARDQWLRQINKTEAV